MNPAGATRDTPTPARGGVGQRAFYWFAWWAVMLAMTAVYRLRRVGYARIPARGPVILVANHQSHLDPPLVALCMPGRQFRPVARASLFANPLFGGLIRALNAIPLRDNEGDLAAIRTAIELLRQGEAVCLFPEGSRTSTGEMGEFKRGVTTLLKRASAPVVPIAIEGAFDAWPRTRRLPRLFAGPIEVRVGRPIPHEELMRDGPEAALARLRREIEALREPMLRRRRRRARRGC